MKRIFLSLLLICMLPLSGCMSANQLAAEKAYYEAKIAVAKQAAAQPIYRMTPGDKGKPIVIDNAVIEVFAQPVAGGNDSLAQYVQKDYAAPWVGLLGQALAIGIPWFGAYKMVDAVAGIPRQGASTSINTYGDKNKTTLGDFTFSANNNAGTFTSPGSMGVLNDHTSPPTVVTQPTPVIVAPSYPPTP